MRNLVWFSAGAASAVALKMASEKYRKVKAVYCDTGSEHFDNERFRLDIERWTGVPIQVIKNPDYKDVDDVIERHRFLRLPNVGARCTTELKKVMRFRFQEPDDRHIFGYTAEEGNRIARMMSDNWDLKIECPLFSAGLKKQDCLNRLTEAGIEIPVMYRLGFNNNNCIGCVKAESPNYWNRVREHFPEVFERRAKQERELNFALTRYRKKPMFLDELPSDLRTRAPEQLSCDFLCRKETPSDE